MSTHPSTEALLAQQAFLRRLTHSLVADPHRADDLAQEAALEALRAGPRRLGAMRAWLRRVVRNRAADDARRERLRADLEAGATPPPDPQAPDEVAERLQTQRRVLLVLERLEEPYRATLLMRYWDDLPPSAIAARTNVPVSTVKSRLTRGLARMRAELDESYGERQAWAVALVGGLRGAKGVELGTAAAAVGGLAMGLKLALASAVIGCGALGTWWWVSNDAAEPLRTQVAHAEPPVLEATREQEHVLAARDAAERTAVPVSTSATTLASPGPQKPATVLELELRGLRPEDAGPLALTIGSVRAESKTDSKGRPLPDVSVRVERELASRLEIDVTTLFQGAEPQPASLHVALDHPQYLPTEAWVLIPAEQPFPERLTGVAELVRAHAILTGLVEVPPVTSRESVRVALYELREAPRDPIDAAVCDSEGRYRLRATDAPRLVLVAWHERPGNSYARDLRPASRQLTLDTTGLVELEPLVMGRGAPLRGHVVHAGGGSPSSGRVRVTLEPSRDGWDSYQLVWRDASFEWAAQSVAIDETGAFEILALPPGRCFLQFSGGLPAGMQGWFKPDERTMQEVHAPDDFVELVLHRIQVTVQVRSREGPVPRAAFLAGYSDKSGGMHSTDESGRVELWIDPRHGLVISYDGGREYLSREMVIPARDLTPGALLELVVERTETLTATLVLQPEGPGASDLYRATVDVFVCDLDERGEPPKGAREYIAGYRGGGMGLVNSDHPIVLRRDPDGACVLSGIPPGKHFVRALPRGLTEPPSFVVPEDFVVELGPGQHEMLVWETTVGGRLRLNARGQLQVKVTELRNAAGEKVPEYHPQLPGFGEVKQALAPGLYELRLFLGGGVIRTVPLRIEAGRVNDVEIDLDSL